MRIILANENRGWGGAEEHTLRLAEKLAARGHDVVMASSHDSVLAERAERSGLSVRRVRMRSEADPFAVNALVGLIRAHRAEVLHTVGTRDHVLGAVAGRLTRTPVVKVEHTWLAGTSSVLCLEAYRRWTTRVICVCEAMHPHLTGMGIPDERISVITNGLDIDHYAAAPRKPNEAPTLAVVASCIPGKGHDTLIEAVRILTARYPNLRVLCAGGGSLKDRLIKKASAGEVADHFGWLGHVDDVRPVLALADMLVHPSHNEALPYAIMEAMASGLPVVATDVGGTGELVEDGITGLLVRPRDASALADGISRVLDDESLRRGAGAAGRRRVAERFTIDRMVSDYEALYDEVRA